MISRLGRRILIFLILILMFDVTIGALFACPWFRPENKPGPPLGHDFLCFYTTSKMALDRQFVYAYSPSKFSIVKDGILNNLGINSKLNCPWVYPPIFMLVVYPLAKLNYWVALSVWSLLLLVLYCFLFHKIAPHRLTYLIAPLFPGAFINFINGQNGFLTSLLIGTGLILIEKNALLAGLMLGLVGYKPHFAVLIPVALIAGRKWKVLSFTILSGACIALASLLILGWPVWAAFFKTASFMSNLVSYGWVKIEGMTLLIPKLRMASTCASVSGFSVSLAWLTQGIVSLVAAYAVIWAWSSNIPAAHRNAILVIAILLFTPYCWDYDLALLGLPLAWIAWDMVKARRYQAGQEWVIFAFVVSPGLCLLVAVFCGIQLIPVFLLLFLTWLLERATKIHPMTEI